MYSWDNELIQYCYEKPGKGTEWIERGDCRMKSKNTQALLQDRENLRDLLEDIMERIKELREEMLTELDDLEDMIAENSTIEFH